MQGRHFCGLGLEEADKVDGRVGFYRERRSRPTTITQQHHLYHRSIHIIVPFKQLPCRRPIGLLRLLHLAPAKISVRASAHRFCRKCAANRIRHENERLALGGPRPIRRRDARRPRRSITARKLRSAGGWVVRCDGSARREL